VATSLATGIIHRLGDSPLFFSALRSVMGGDCYRQGVLDEAIGERCPSMRVLDLGCGTGQMARWVQPAQYVGVDSNPAYLRYATRHAPAGARFLELDLARANLASCNIGVFDVVLAMGLLHHLSNSGVHWLLGAVTQLLGPAGKMVTIDGARVPDTARTARRLMAGDKGNFVRSPVEYEELLSRHFRSVRGRTRRDLLRVPISGAPYPLHSIVARGSKRVE